MTKPLFLRALLPLFCLTFLPSPAWADDDYVTIQTAVGGRKFTFNVYGEGSPRNHAQLAPSTWDLNAAEKNDILRAARVWAEVLKPGSGSGYAVTYDVATMDQKDNANCGSPFASEANALTTVASAIVNGRTQTNRSDFGFMTIGDLVDSANGLALSPLPANNDFIATIYHEMAHSLGLLARTPTLNGAKSARMSAMGAWDTHLLDRNLHWLAQGKTVSIDPADASSTDAGVFFVGERNQSGVRFVGQHVAHVLSDRTESSNALAYEALTSQQKYDYGLTIEGVEKFGTPKADIDLSHIELERSLMSHQTYRNYAVFMEAELAALQDIGYTIDRGRFYGRSLYRDNQTFTLTDDATGVSGTLGVGLHVYGKNNTVTVAANLAAGGEAGTGVRMDGSASSLTVTGSNTVAANGKNGTGLLVAYGKNHVVAIESGASVTATGAGGIGARFDFGHNLCGDHDEYRGSYIRWKKEDGAKKNMSVKGEDTDDIALNLDGPLVKTFTVRGTLTGRKAAVLISENALVQTINIESGATVTGDIISEWDAQNKDIQYSGSRGGLVTTLNLTGRLDGGIDGLDGIRLVNKAAHTLQSVKVNSLTDTGGLTIGNGADPATLAVAGNTVVANNATLTLAAKSEADFMGALTVTDGMVSGIGSSVHAGALAMRGGRMSMTQSFFAADAVADNAVNGWVLVGDGAAAVLGARGFDTADVVPAALRQAGADAQAVLAVGAPVRLGSAGALHVDPSATFSGNAIASAHADGQVADITTGTQRAYFAPDSLLVLDPVALGGKAAITDATNAHTAFVDNGARLHVLNATVAGGTILQGFQGVSLHGWEDVTSPERMLSLNTELADGGATVMLTASVNDPRQVMPGLGDGSAAIMRALWSQGGNDARSPYGGVAFLSRAARTDYIANAHDAARAIESATHIAFAGGVPHMTFSANNAAASAAASRTGLGRRPSSVQAVAADGSAQTGLSAGDGYGTTGLAMWITPLFQSWQGRDLTSDELALDVNGRLGGVALGADYTFENALRAGIAFNIGGGYAKGGGQFADTTNNFNFWGLGAYAGWTRNAFALTADVSYTSSFHNLRQELPATLGMGDRLKADASSYALSAGLRAEYTLHGRMLDLTPHAAVRHTYLHVDSYEAEANGRTVLEGDAIRQSIWSFPVGLTLSKDVPLDNGWHVRPLLDFLLTPYAGDVRARADVRFAGVGATGEMQSQMLDYVTWGCRLGFEAGSEQVKLGLDYNLQVGTHSISHGVFGTFRYEF